jgi:hypothetical protein
MGLGCLGSTINHYGINMKKFFIMTTIALALVGCASDKTKLVELPTSKGVPEWFASEPPKSEKEIIVTATDSSRNMQFAIDKAMMNARVELANRINVKIESLVKEQLTEDGAGNMKDVNREVERVSKQVTNQTLSMYTREKLFVAKEDEGFRAYVMLKIDVDQGRRLVDSNRKSPKDSKDKFKELDDSVTDKSKL